MDGSASYRPTGDVVAAVAGVSGTFMIDSVEVFAENATARPRQSAVEYLFKDLPPIVFTAQRAGVFANADILGSGCGVPPLLQSATRPVLGTTVTLTIASIPIGSFAGVELLGGVQVPGIDLSFLGMPTCLLFANPLYVTVPFSTASATAQVQLPIPSATNLIGATLATQAATVTPGANARGLLTSTGLRLVVGDN